MLNPFLQTAFVLFFAFLGFVAGAGVGSGFVPDGSGLAGPPIVLVYGLGGLVLALIGGIVLARRLRTTTLHWALVVAAVLAALVVWWIGFRIASTQAAAVTASAVVLPAVPSFSQRYPTIPREDLPIGLGIAHVTPAPGRTLRFYREPGVGQVPGDYPASDTVTFGAGLPSVEITEAPPWLVPEHLKMDYELFYLRVLTLTRDWAEVIGNSSTGETWWIDRTEMRFAAWPEFLLSANSVQPLDINANQVRARPLDDAPILAEASEPLMPLAVQGDWLKVDIHLLADRIPPEGWIRWRRGDRLLVAYNPLS